MSETSVTFTHSVEMLRHAFWLVLSFLQGRHYKIILSKHVGVERPK